MPRCPGQDQRFWKPKDIFEVKCHGCGTSIEFWKDDPKRICGKCKTVVINPNLDMGCAAWCPYAEECLGQVKGQDARILCDKLVEQMSQVLANSPTRIDRILTILNYASEIQKTEGGDPLIVKAGAILHDLASKTDIRAILTRQGIDAEAGETIGRLADALNQGEHLESIEFQILTDARRLADLPRPTGKPACEKAKIDFLTASARRIAIQHQGLAPD